MAYDKSTLAATIIDAEVNYVRSLAKKAGIINQNPELNCCGIQWALKKISDGVLTAEDLRLAFIAEFDGDKGAWAAGLLSNQWDDLYPEFRNSLIDALHGDNCTHVMMRISQKLSSGQKSKIRKRFLAEKKRSGRDASSDFYEYKKKITK
jgi:hypothetical protein